jgi:purine-nucleoside phosphorylase
MVFEHSPAIALDDSVARAVTVIRRRTSGRPRIGLILGSGLGALADDVEDAVAIAFGDVPGFPAPTVPGHSGQIVIGDFARRRVVMMSGRAHHYEGHSMAVLTFPVRVLAALGCEVLIVTNSAGGLNPSYRSGDLMAITDHIFLPGLVGLNPLASWHGPPSDRFVDMGSAYDPGLHDLATAAAAEIGEPLHHGVYVMVGGPSYETPAEQRFLRVIGGDAVGMSTSPEVVVARQCRLRVLGLSLITNLALGQHDAQVSHAEVLEEATRSNTRFRSLVTQIVARIEMPDDES